MSHKYTLKLCGFCFVFMQHKQQPHVFEGTNTCSSEFIIFSFLFKFDTVAAVAIAAFVAAKLIQPETVSLF